MEGWVNGTMVGMACDVCFHVWQCEEEDSGNQRCPECGDEAAHRRVGRAVLERIWMLLGDRAVKREQLVRAFAACTVGGVAFAEIVFGRAVEMGLLTVANGLVRRGPVPVLEVWD